MLDIFLMLIVDGGCYLGLALYLDAVFPGRYGVPKPWYYLFLVRLLSITYIISLFVHLVQTC